MKKKSYLNKKEYNEWLRILREHIENILKQNNADYTYTKSDNPEFSNRYEIRNIPNIGTLRIAIEPYECAKHSGCRGVNTFAVYCRFDTFIDSENKLPYGDQFNHYSGKYNFHCIYPEHYTLIPAFIFALSAIFDLSKN